MPKWKRFERLAEKILAELSPKANVTWNDQIMGKESGTNRQIDVSIRRTVQNQPVLIIVQARDQGKPADINTVGEFSAVVKDVQATRGILVCRKGFTAKAKEYARNLGIDLCRIHDAESRDWCLEITIPIIWIDLKPDVQFHVEAHFEGEDSVEKDMTQWTLSEDRGKTRANAFSTFERAWNTGKLPRHIGAVHQVLTPQDFELRVLDKEKKPAWRRVFSVKFVYTVSRKAWLGQFSPDECRGILDELRFAFVASYLPLGQIPTKRDDRWKEIADPDKVAIRLAGTFVTTEGWQVMTGSAKSTINPQIRKIE